VSRQYYRSWSISSSFFISMSNNMAKISPSLNDSSWSSSWSQSSMNLREHQRYQGKHSLDSKYHNSCSRLSPSFNSNGLKTLPKVYKTRMRLHQVKRQSSLERCLTPSFTGLTNHLTWLKVSYPSKIHLKLLSISSLSTREAKYFFKSFQPSTSSRRRRPELPKL